MMDEPNLIKLTLKKREQLRRVLAGESVTEASKAAGYASISTGSHALANTREKLCDIMDRLYLTDEQLVKKYLMPLLEANTTQFFAKDGIITDSATIEDNGTRRESLRMAFKLRGSFPSESSGGPHSLNINIANVSAGKEKE
jgi:hypothetical protein